MNNTQINVIEKYMDKLTLASIWSIFLFSYVSVSAAALSHIFIVLPAIYYTYIYIQKNEFKLSKSSFFLLLTVLIAVISVLFAEDISKKFHQISKVKYMLFAILAIIPYQKVLKKISNKQITLMITIFLILLILGNIAGIHALFTGHHILRMKKASDSVRAAGMYGMAITYGYGIQLVVIICLGILINFWHKINLFVNRNLLIFSTITSCLGLYFSFTRGALLALIISFPFIFIKKKKIFFTLVLTGLVVLSSIVFLVWNGNDSGNRFLLSAKNNSNMIRISQYQAAIEGFKEMPLLGYGYRNFEKNSVEIKKRHGIPFQDFRGHAHNNYLEFLVSTGGFGFISFIMFVLFWFKEMLFKNDSFGLVLMPFVVSFAVSGLFQNTINDAENMFFIMFIYTISQIKIWRCDAA